MEKWNWDLIWDFLSFMVMYVYKKGIFRYRRFNNVNFIFF